MDLLLWNWRTREYFKVESMCATTHILRWNTCVQLHTLIAGEKQVLELLTFSSSYFNWWHFSARFDRKNRHFLFFLWPRRSSRYFYTLSFVKGMRMLLTTPFVGCCCDCLEHTLSVFQFAQYYISRVFNSRTENRYIRADFNSRTLNAGKRDKIE